MSKLFSAVACEKIKKLNKKISTTIASYSMLCTVLVFETKPTKITAETSTKQIILSLSSPFSKWFEQQSITTTIYIFFKILKAVITENRPNYDNKIVILDIKQLKLGIKKLFLYSTKLGEAKRKNWKLEKVVISFIYFQSWSWEYFLPLGINCLHGCWSFTVL